MADYSSLLEICYLSRSFTRVKPHAAILSLNFHLAATSHSPKHWSSEGIMIQICENFIHDDIPVLVIMDNFKGQITSTVKELSESNNIHVCLLPPNTTDQFQPMIYVQRDRAHVRVCLISNLLHHRKLKP